MHASEIDYCFVSESPTLTGNFSAHKNYNIPDGKASCYAMKPALWSLFFLLDMIAVEKGYAISMLAGLILIMPILVGYLYETEDGIIYPSSDDVLLLIKDLVLPTQGSVDLSKCPPETLQLRHGWPGLHPDVHSE